MKTGAATGDADYLRESGLKYLAVRPRSEKELLDYLEKRASAKGITAGEARLIFEALKKTDLVNDRKFAAWWVEVRKGKAARGDAFIRHELRMRGVPEIAIEDALSSSVTAGGEYERAVSFLVNNRKKWSSYSGLNRREKISRLLSYRGFPYSVISRLIDEYG